MSENHFPYTLLGIISVNLELANLVLVAIIVSLSLSPCSSLPLVAQSKAEEGVNVYGRSHKLRNVVLKMHLKLQVIEGYKCSIIRPCSQA